MQRGRTYIVKVDASLSDLIPGFLKNRRKDVIMLHEALKKSDFEVVEIVGHRLRGNAGGYGFDELGLLGAQMEIAGQKHDRTGAAKLAIQLADYITHVEIQYVESA